MSNIIKPRTKQQNTHSIYIYIYNQTRRVLPNQAYTTQATECLHKHTTKQHHKHIQTTQTHNTTIHTHKQQHKNTHKHTFNNTNTQIQKTKKHNNTNKTY